jgi:hypothetical protein
MSFSTTRVHPKRRLFAAFIGQRVFDTEFLVKLVGSVDGYLRFFRFEEAPGMG